MVRWVLWVRREQLHEHKDPDFSMRNSLSVGFNVVADWCKLLNMLEKSVRKAAGNIQYKIIYSLLIKI